MGVISHFQQHDQKMKRLKTLPKAGILPHTVFNIVQRRERVTYWTYTKKRYTVDKIKLKVVTTEMKDPWYFGLIEKLN